jgi:hypothetical protein
MKNIQVIDGAMNSAYDIYSCTEEDFNIKFPEPGQNIEFIEYVLSRVEESFLPYLMEPIWGRPIRNHEVNGIHGTLFYRIEYKKKYSK